MAAAQRRQVEVKVISTSTIVATGAAVSSVEFCLGDNFAPEIST
jgi:hypothetical protein